MNHTTDQPPHRVAPPQPGQVWMARHGNRKGTQVTILSTDPPTAYNGWVRVQGPNRVSTMRFRTLESRYSLILDAAPHESRHGQ